jgi:diguanylate cyclase (GGDEF)-like protein
MNKKALVDRQGDTTGGRRRILVVDGSRVVRATLAKHLGDSFELLQESNGESAWQTLLLDGRVDAVVSGISPPKLEARELLGRIRASAVRRVRDVPFVLIVSDLENPAVADLPNWPGVAGCISKSMDKATLLAELARLIDPVPDPVDVPAPRLLGRKEFAAAVASLSFSEKDEQQTCMIVFGIDHLDELVSRFGKAVPEMLTSRLADLLSAKVDSLDQFGQAEGKHLAIISHGVDLRHGSRFAKRVCKSLASGQITIQGQKIKLTASAGVASTSEDKVARGAELLALAQQRLAQAQLCGGNSASAELRPDCPLHCRDKAIASLLLALRGGSAAMPVEQLAVAGLKVLPLLKALDRHLLLGLPLEEIRARIEERLEKSRPVCA